MNLMKMKMNVIKMKMNVIINNEVAIHIQKKRVQLIP
jgi:hypothetical protein